MTYSPAVRADQLILGLEDGRSCRVVFDEPAAALEARRPGRSYLDAVAIALGLLPRGACEVLRSTSPSEGASADPHPSSTVAYVLGFGCSAMRPLRGPIDRKADAAARRAQPADAELYDDLALALGAEPGSPKHMRHALIADILGRHDATVEHRERAIRTACQFHPDPSRGLYLYGPKQRFFCFSCGRGGDGPRWLTARHCVAAGRADDPRE